MCEFASKAIFEGFSCCYTGSRKKPEREMGLNIRWEIPPEIYSPFSSSKKYTFKSLPLIFVSPDPVIIELHFYYQLKYMTSWLSSLFEPISLLITFYQRQLGSCWASVPFFSLHFLTDFSTLSRQVHLETSETTLRPNSLQLNLTFTKLLWKNCFFLHI